MGDEKRAYTKLEPGYYEDELTYKYVDGFSRGTYNLDKPQQGINPAISVYANNLPSGWELAMLSCWDYGARVGTHYDPKDDTPKSKEATISIKISDPFNEPRISLPGFPAGPAELEVYRQEVVHGIHNHWIKPGTSKWTYTYNERLTDYNPSKGLHLPNRGVLLEKGVNQIDGVIDDLERDITSKGAQVTTWMPTADPGLEGSRPCLQRLWFRPLQIDKADESKGYFLNLNSHWRSRDLAKAWFMNSYAITDWNKNIAERLQDRMGIPIKVGSYTDISDSLHIYGAYFNETKAEFEKMRNEPIKGNEEKGMRSRVWTSDYPAFVMMTEEAKVNLAKDPDYYAKGDLAKK